MKPWTILLVMGIFALVKYRQSKVAGNDILLNNTLAIEITVEVSRIIKAV
jgi:hypothetical protein